MEPTIEMTARPAPYAPKKITKDMPEGFFLIDLFFEKLQVVETMKGFVVTRIAMVDDDAQFEVIGTVNADAITALLNSSMMDREACEFLKANTI